MARATKRTLKKMMVGSLAVKANFITQDQLDEVEQLQNRYEQAGKKVPSIGELLAHKGYLTKDQVVALLKGSYSVQQGLFGEIAQRLKFASLEQVEDSLEIQHQGSNNGKPALPIGQVMVAQGHLRPNQILAVLRAQGKTVARCAACGAAYNVPEFQPGQFTCAACEGVLIEVKDLEAAPKRPSGPATKKTAKPLPQLHQGDKYAEFEIESKLGSDPLGDLYLAADHKKNRSILVRIFDPARMLNPSFKKKLLDQAKTASKLDHPHIQRIITLGKSKSCYYLATEHIRGETLHDKLRGRKPLDYPEAMRMFAETVDALGYAHENGLIHGDIRPANILITTDGHTRLQGLAVPFDDSIVERWFMASKGGLQALYMAPEQVSEAHGLEERSDMFALGCTMYHALTGTPPYKGKSPADLLTQLTERGVPSVRKNNHSVPNETADLISKMLGVEPEDRYESMKALAEEIEKLPKESASRMAKIDYAAVLGDAATAAPSKKSKRASAPPPKDAPAAGKSAEKPAGKQKTVGKMSYSELVGQMSDEAAEADAVDAATQAAKGPKSLIELSGSAGKAYRAIEMGERIKMPKFFKVVFVVTTLLALLFATGLTIKSHLDHEEIKKQNEANQVEGPPPAPSNSPDPEEANRERLALQFQQIEVAYKQAIQLMTQKRLDAVIHKLRQEVLKFGVAWKGMGDAHNLIARAFYYKAYIDRHFDDHDKSIKKDWTGAAMAHFKEAQKFYRQKHTVVGFSLSVQPWMPEAEDERLFKNKKPRGLIKYQSKRDAAKWMGKYSVLARDFFSGR